MAKSSLFCIATILLLIPGCFDDSWEEDRTYRYVSSESYFHQNFSESSLVTAAGSMGVTVNGTAMTFSSNSKMYYSDEYIVLYSESGSAGLLLSFPNDLDSFSLSLDEKNYFIFLEYNDGGSTEMAGWFEPIYSDKLSNKTTGIITIDGSLNGAPAEIGDSGGSISGNFSAAAGSFNFSAGTFSFTRP